MKEHPISAVAWCKERVKRLEEWDRLQQEKAEVWADRLRVKNISVYDRMSKESFQRLLPRRSSQPMKELAHLFHDSEPRASKPAELCEYAACYFQDILTSRRQGEGANADLSKESLHWQNLKVRLPVQGRLDLDRPIRVEEAKATMAEGKVPGDDGLPVEFYSTFWHILGEDLVSIFNGILVGENLPRNACNGIISVLFKKGDKSEIRNWRPISLLNVAYKIRAKVLASRLGRYSPELVSVDQAAFVRGRSIFVNIITAIEVMETVQEENMDFAVLLLDMEKAYDRVNWSYVLTTLKILGFGDCFCKWVVDNQDELLQQRVLNRLATWGKAPHLSLMGRALVVNVALFALPWYVGRVRPLGTKTRAVVRRRAARFIWKPCGSESEGFISKVACHSRQEGGLGLKDPGKQNMAMLAAWIPKAMAANEDEHWVFVAESLLMKSWHLRRREDVWACVNIDSYLRRPVCSELWTGILKAWKKVKPDKWSDPVTKQEVLMQVIFENPLVKNREGRWLAADRKPGSFGRTWIEKGVVRIRDIWDEFRNDWRVAEELDMGNLKRVEEKLAEIIEAIPASWKDLLDPGSLDPPGTWYTDKMTRDATHFWKLVCYKEEGGRERRGANSSSVQLALAMRMVNLLDHHRC
ncbi:hypothetical protein CBR_g28748 [Chara braunii]|uniref:Reverse transcriptase domain-containing protein n=1 Tax=Chara braunii TaxID=69332 RepID=A0A388L9S7_CHABU|nr:hypothetical protein CBR_g28748 [Chara braunii]|eukprot:GBG79034.1 hypothetical protein CBR_g28748 [Chara braunii]